MRKPRLLDLESMNGATYHCTSRVVDRQHVFGDVERDTFVEYMRMYERLCGLDVRTFCVMTNHFHILVHVPLRPEILPTNEELVALVRASLGKKDADKLDGWFRRWEELNDPLSIEKERERWFRNMWSLSEFMKMLKQRFAQWFNGSRPERREGALWSSRFHSVLTEDGEALQAQAMYIDLNPVRAGIVGDPKDYRWSGYGEAYAGVAAAQAGLMQVARASDPTRGQPQWTDVSANAAPPSIPLVLSLDPALRMPPDPHFELLSWYRDQLFGIGVEIVDVDGNIIRHGCSEAEFQEMAATGGCLPLPALLRQRVRSFTLGGVLGKAPYVQRIFEAHRTSFAKKRTIGPRSIHSLHQNCPLRTARAYPKQPSG